MVTVRLPTLRSRLDRASQRSVSAGAEVSGGEVSSPPRRVGRLGVRDHRDDGSAIGGLLVGTSLAVLIWGLVVALLVVLL